MKEWAKTLNLLGEMACAVALTVGSVKGATKSYFQSIRLVEGTEKAGSSAMGEQIQRIQMSLFEYFQDTDSFSLTEAK